MLRRRRVLKVPPLAPLRTYWQLMTSGGGVRAVAIGRFPTPVDDPTPMSTHEAITVLRGMKKIIIMKGGHEVGKEM